MSFKAFELSHDCDHDRYEDNASMRESFVSQFAAIRE
jgi:hypothetical protein